MEVTGDAQRAAWQERTLPPVEHVRRGLWSVPVPMGGPLRWVNAYVLELAGGGLGLVDTGWDADESWAALRAGLTAIGGDVTDVRGVLVTHLHLDHVGLAARVREASGAWVAMHPADAEGIATFTDRTPEQMWAEEVAFLIGLGAPPEDARADAGTPEQWIGLRRVARPDRLLEDGDRADLPGWSLRAVHTPGHTAGHLCFADEATGLFFAGDHVLPRISPNISTHAGGAADPLRDYLGALAGVGGREAGEVLPGHEWRFRGLAERTRELREHHERRLAELLAAVRAHPGSTPWDLAAHLTWSRPWAQYERRMRIFAVTETDAHLRLLASRGLVAGDGGTVPVWTAAPVR
ncbi:glyoxylase-like metal-dependent hydrolase (beta-lactamase superfamily II) [Geodermatophilus bullaregiensis]|uniref:MBL fold metallo-hydrolase n=1 Tax=Geodermatophilus bullaregiensis TaxID=1564160 RepID=UPI001956B874|nr:MBL fold metallo-hydrolase [Geodermatophilus bullaregiensis]MBM7804579.1 glyoxylase-like metal-dependent hydrolase (beta-lactamase superfamily II) [Geodermatophilus bullaregiensis]